MELFDEYLERIGDPRHRARIQEVLAWVAETFPELTPRTAWSQPMFTHHGTFIIGFSTAKNHLAIAPERAGGSSVFQRISAGRLFAQPAAAAHGMGPAGGLRAARSHDSIYLEDKAACTTFWRP